MPAPKKPQDHLPKATPETEVVPFTWTSEAGVTVRLLPAAEIPYGAFEDALDKGEMVGMTLLVRAACITPDDHTAMRSLKMRQIEDLFAAWNGGASAGESARSSS